jgi:hypothetical protein
MSHRGTQNEEEAETLLEKIPTEDPSAKEKHNQKMLVISFLLLIVIGLGNKIFQKLQTEPMHNYPYFLNLLTTFIYIPLSFAYIWPMMFWGKAITQEQRDIPWYKFAVMGILDGIAGLMQSFAVNGLAGPLIQLLMQAAIPISMIISKLILKAKYGGHHYVGATVVVLGLLLVMIPTFLPGHEGNSNKSSQLMIAVWSCVLIASCIPMTLSSVYKEKALGEVEIDVVYMNGWIAVYQLIMTLILAVPSAYASSLTVEQLPENIWGGAKCYAGYNSVFKEHGDIKVDHCGMAPIYVTLYIFFNVLYNILIIMILKYGSANILWLAMTFMVPLANFSFSLPFMPSPQPLTWYNIVGLVIIMLGLTTYRFFPLVREYVGRFTGAKKLHAINRVDSDQ